MTAASDCLSITAAQLMAWGACPDQVQIFRATFGEEAPVTEEALAQALAAGLSIPWLVRYTLNVPAQAAFDLVHLSAHKEYQWCAYDRACDPTRAAYRRVCASAWFQLYRIPANRKDT